MISKIYLRGSYIMRKIMFVFILFILSNLLVSCSEKITYEAYIEVYLEKYYLDGFKEKYTIGNGLGLYNYQASIYHIDTNKKNIQKQPYKSNNVISDINLAWEKFISLEKFDLEKVYYRNGDNYFNSEVKEVNNNDIDIFELIIHNEYMNSIIIKTKYFIRASDVTIFEINYKIDELE